MRRIFLPILTFLILACGRDNPITPSPTNFLDTVLQTYGGTDKDAGVSITATSDGGHAIAGTFRSIDGDFDGLNKGINDIFVMKFDPKGIREWMKTYGGSESDYAHSIAQTFDNGFVIVGRTGSDDGDFNVLNKGGTDIFVLKLDKKGEKQWLDTFGGTRSEFSNSIAQTRDGGYVLTGGFNSSDGDFEGLPSHNNLDVFVLKIRGNKQWLKTFGGDNRDNNEIGFSIVETSDGSFVITGYTISQDGDFDQCNLRCLEDIFVLKIDTDGNHVWTKRFGGSHADLGRSIATTTDGVIVTGLSGSNDGDFSGLNKGLEDIFALKLDLDGNLQWIKNYGGSSSENGISIIEINDSGYILTGSSSSNEGDFNELNKGSSDIFVMKIDLDGDIQWVDTFGGTRDEFGNSIAQTTDGGYVLTGGFNSSDGYFEGHNLRGEDKFEDIFIIKLGTNKENNLKKMERGCAY